MHRKEAHVAKKTISSKAPVQSKEAGKKGAPTQPAQGAAMKKGAPPIITRGKK